MRLRDLGITVGRFRTGQRNSIADVDGVTVGHSTVIHGDGELRIGTGPARTGVTVIVPHGGDTWTEPRFAGWFMLNGVGEWTGLHFIAETGSLYGNVYTTNSHSIGTVRDAIIASESSRRNDEFMVLPVVGETFDGGLNDIAGLHVRAEHVDEATRTASTEVAEGNVGGGTGMICHGFKGGIGTSSRVVETAGSSYTVGVIVQANHGERDGFQVNGVPVGSIIGRDVVPDPWEPQTSQLLGEKNSILITVATDAPLLPNQCTRLAHRATLGIAMNGGTGHYTSGDFALAFSTVDQGVAAFDLGAPKVISGLTCLSNSSLDPLFDSVVECTQEAIVNALVAAETMVGRDGVTAYGLDPALLRKVVSEYRHL
jgi:D-aminopeptidase